jgi:hypothetical protein
MRKLPLVLFLCSLATTALRADTLTNLRTILSRYRGTTPVSGTLELHVQQQSSDDDDPKKKNEQGQATVAFESGQAGLTLSYPAALLEKSRQEDRAHSLDPEATQPIRAALAQVQPLELAESLNAAERLLRQLQRAKLLEDKASTIDGKPGRVLVIALELPLDKSDKKHVKSAEARLNLWTSLDGTPLRADYTTTIKVSYLLMKFQTQQLESAIFAVHNDRLIAIQRQEKSSGSGVGQSFSSNVVSTIRVER